MTWKKNEFEEVGADGGVEFLVVVPILESDRHTNALFPHEVHEYLTMLEEKATKLIADCVRFGYVPPSLHDLEQFIQSGGQNNG